MRSGNEGAAARNLAHIGLGSNLGDRLEYLRRAVALLRRAGAVRSVSSVYETDPVGFLDQPAFLNAAVSLETALVPAALVATLLDIERDLGRVRTFRNAPRAIDLDLLLLGDTMVDEPSVTVPHPRLHERAFVLVPLAEIAAGAVHPVLGKTVGALRDELGPQGEVRRVPLSLA